MAPHVSNSHFTNYYDVLHLPRDATKTQIRQRFKKLLLLFHPDKNKDEDAPRIFRSLKTAEEVLSDNTKKALFDCQLHEIDSFLKSGSARAAAASAARTAAERYAENRARDQRHYERDRARAQQSNADAQQGNSRGPGNNAPFTNYAEPKGSANNTKKTRPPRPREDIYMRPQYKPSGRQPPWSILGRIPKDDSYLPWGKNPMPIGSKNPFNPNPFTREEIPVHGNWPLNPGDHCSPKIDAGWPIVHNEGYRVLRGCSDLYRNQWKDTVAEAAMVDIKSYPLLEEGLRRIEYMFHKFAEYVWGLLTDLPRNMVAIIDPEAALEKLETVMFTLQEFCHRGQHMPMEMGSLAQGVKRFGDPVEEEPAISREQGHNQVLRLLAQLYETFMGEQSAEEMEQL